MPFFDRCVAPILDLLYPERCALCGVLYDGTAWADRGPLVPGLRCWDQSHLCRACEFSLIDEPTQGIVASSGACNLPILAAGRTSPQWVELVGAWKYHGLRGLVWPLARGLARSIPADLWNPSPPILVPVPLHRSRERARGFNQAELLANLVGAILEAPVNNRLLFRRRATGQQAKVVGAEQRESNLYDAFRCSVESLPVPTAPLLLVDDLVTSGATVGSAAAELERNGWTVAGVLALGLAQTAK